MWNNRPWIPYLPETNFPTPDQIAFRVLVWYANWGTKVWTFSEILHSFDYLPQSAFLGYLGVRVSEETAARSQGSPISPCSTSNLVAPSAMNFGRWQISCWKLMSWLVWESCRVWLGCGEKPLCMPWTSQFKAARQFQIKLSTYMAGFSNHGLLGYTSWEILTHMWTHPNDRM